jgi:3-dehydroquinate dehydratase
VWLQKDYTSNKLVKSYLGLEIPQNQYESNDILPENISYYKDCISRAMGVARTTLDIPIIYTVRSKQDGGHLDTKKSTDFALYNDLVMFGAKEMKADLIDIEFQYEHNMQGIKDIIE